MNLWSVLRNGNVRKKIPIGMMKNWLPPQAEIENDVKIPAATSFKNAIFLFCEFIPLNKKYRIKRLKNNPNGSDLNHPIGPLINIGIETENSMAENKPAVVPPITLTIAKITIADNDPKITGNKIVKSYRSVPPANNQYVVAAVRWSITWEVEDTSLPWGYQLRLSFHSKYSVIPLSTMYWVAR